jgi:hypothetical protein
MKKLRVDPIAEMLDIEPDLQGALTQLSRRFGTKKTLPKV